MGMGERKEGGYVHIAILSSLVIKGEGVRKVETEIVEGEITEETERESEIKQWCLGRFVWLYLCLVYFT